MASTGHLLAVSVIISVFFSYTFAENIPGVVPLNSHTFDKIIPKFSATLVKIDETYPYGDKQDAFKTVAEATLEQKEMLIAEIHVADYGDKENSDLAERFGVTKDDFPVYKLFVQGKSEPITYSGDVKNADSIKKFLIRESGLWLGLPACIEEFDNMIKDFFKASFQDEQQAIVDKAQALASKITEEPKKTRASVYVKTMQKVMEKGEDFIKQELARVDKLSEEKVSEKKKQQLRDRSSILTSFQMRMKGEVLAHEEL